MMKIDIGQNSELKNKVNGNRKNILTRAAKLDFLNDHRTKIQTPKHIKAVSGDRESITPILVATPFPPLPCRKIE
jgi:hypothetical protein